MDLKAVHFGIIVPLTASPIPYSLVQTHFVQLPDPAVLPMLPYSLIRPLLFSLDAERAHDWTMQALASTQHSALAALYRQKRIEDPVTIAGLRFPNRIGLAAGLDKNARCIDAFAHMGFGFVEVGTVTPLAQPGNPKPRMFRLPKAQALINRLGFNNLGLENFIHNVRRAHFQKMGGILGLNIGKNAATPIAHAADDYVRALEGVYPYADYVAINISSPNTQNLRELQNDTELAQLLNRLCEARRELDTKQAGVSKPLFVKVAPDLSDTQVQALCQTLKKSGVDGIIATNTTISRTTVQGLAHAQETGGLSGGPVLQASNQIIRSLRSELGPNFPIIGVGGVLSAEDALQKRQAGADLVQIYTGLIYKGPKLVAQCAQKLAWSV